MNSDLLAPYVQSFFRDFLVAQRDVSRNTVMSYRDTFRLFLSFASQSQEMPVPEMMIKDVGPDTVLAFLDHIERERDNSVASRNVRAACLRMFFRYLAGEHPPSAELCRRVTAIPRKKHPFSLVGYLEADELQAILTAVDRATARGRRDYTLLWLLYDTGARVQEALDLKVAALQLVPPEQVRVLGKGRKERGCPLSKETAAIVCSYLKELGISEQSDAAVFVGRHGQPMTRSGVARLIKKYTALAARTMPTLRGRNITPHTMRHTTAMHMLQAGVDLDVIRAVLGHVSVLTTHKYAQIDMEMKRRALDAMGGARKTAPEEMPPWHRQPDLLEWLEAL
ncbi:MAG: tyrosine-type recombinase/integrase [Candidatus Krumholzibacteriia bacterium]